MPLSDYKKKDDKKKKPKFKIVPRKKKEEEKKPEKKKPKFKIVPKKVAPVKKKRVRDKDKYNITNFIKESNFDNIDTDEYQEGLYTGVYGYGDDDESPYDNPRIVRRLNKVQKVTQKRVERAGRDFFREQGANYKALDDLAEAFKRAYNNDEIYLDDYMREDEI